MKRLAALFCLMICLSLACTAFADTIEVRIVTLGRYEQDGDETNGPEPIEWVVLHGTGPMQLVISLKCLDARRFHEKGLNTDPTWETCALREWLNEDFYQKAFNEEEKKKIQKMAVTNGQPDGYPDFKAYGASVNREKIYLMSYKELMAFAPSLPVAEATPYALSVSKEAGSFWLRSPGPDQSTALYLGRDGKLSFETATFGIFGVRPMMTVLIPEE